MKMKMKMNQFDQLMSADKMTALYDKIADLEKRNAQLSAAILKADADRETEYAALVALCDGQRDMIQTLEAEIAHMRNSAPTAPDGEAAELLADAAWLGQNDDPE